MRGREDVVRRALADPVEIRGSKRDPAVYLYYCADGPYFVCAVVRHLNGDGFLIIAYRTDAMKEGDRVWTR